MSINAARPLNPMDTTFRGAYIPGGEQRATQAVDKQVVRITPENRQGLDVMLTPADQKKLFEQGYLDVQRSFTVMESNEGMFSLLGKSLACVFGPSKSIGAIKIDPMFLEMIKDPNAKIGFGYTRVQNETLNVLPSPVAPPKPEPRPQPPVPPYESPMNPTRPQQRQPPGQEPRRFDPSNPQATPFHPRALAQQGNRRYIVETHREDSHARTSSFNDVNDTTWSGAHIEAALQDRELAESHQRISRLAIDLNSLASGNIPNGPGELEGRIRNYLQPYFSPAEIRGVIAAAKSGKGAEVIQVGGQNLMDRASRQISRDQLPDYAATRVIEQHAQDFRAIGYVSEANATEVTDHIGRLSSGQSNQILNTQITGTHRNKDGVVHFYDTERMLSSRKIQPQGNDPGYPAYASDPRYAGAQNLYDVYSTQTQNTPIPDNAVDDYVKLYNQTFPSSQTTADQVKGLNPPATLKDMYALRAHDYRNLVNVSASGGRVVVGGNQETAMRNINNVRLVLEANSPGVATHVFDDAAIESVNTRAAYNFRATPLALQDNANASQVTGTTPQQRIEQTVSRIQLKDGEDLDAIDTQKHNATHANTSVGKVGYGFQSTGSGSGSVAQNITQVQEDIASLRSAGAGVNNLDQAVSELQANIDTLKRTPNLTDAQRQQITTLETSLGEARTAVGGVQQQSLQQTVTANIAGLGQSGLTPENVTTAKATIQGQITALQNAGVDVTNISPPVQLGERSFTNLNDALAAAEGVAKSSPPSAQGQPYYDSTELATNLNNYVKGLEGFQANLNNNVSVNPQSVNNLLREADWTLEQLATAQPKVEDSTEIEVAKADGTKEKVTVGALRTRLDAVRADAKIQRAVATGGRAGAEAGSGAANGGGYVEQTNQSLTEFNTFLKSAIADGQITTTERDQIQSYVDGIARNTGRYLEDMGVSKMAGSANMSVSDLKAGLASLNAQDLGPSRLNPAQISTTLETLDRISGAQASVNLSMSEGQYSNSLYQNVRNLSQRLDQFQSVEVAKTAYRGMMTEMATSQPEVFNNMMSVAYGLPAPGTPGTEQAYTELQNAAKSGSLPFPPNIGFVDRAQLGGANAAYTNLGNDPDNPRRVAGPTILLASDLVSQPDLLREAFTEEMFHHLEKNTNIQGLLETGASERITAAENILLDPNATSEQLTQAQSDLTAARTDLTAAKSRTMDARGDEGRAGLYALRQVQAGNTDRATLEQAADIGRDQRAQVSGNIRLTENNERFDQGTVQSAIVGARGAVVVEAGADLEFSSAAPAVQGGASPVQGAQATGVRPAAAASAAAPGLPPQQMEALRQSFNEAAAEYKPRLQAIDQEREALKQQNRGRVPATDARRLDQAQQAIEQEMGQRFRQQNNIPMTVNWQRGEIFGSLPSEVVGPQVQATFTTAAYRTSSDPHQADMNQDYRDTGLQVQPLNPNRSMQREMVMHERGGFGETRAAGNFRGMEQNNPANVNGPDGRPRFNQDLLAFDQSGGVQQASFDTPERFDSKFSEMMHGMWEGIKSSPKFLPDIGSGMEVMGKAFTAYADKWRDQMKELWFGPQGVCKNLSMYSLTAHNVIYGEGGGPGNETDGLKVGDDANEYNFHKTTSQAGLPDYASAQQQVAQRDSQYRSDMRQGMTLSERNREKQPKPLGF